MTRGDADLSPEVLQRAAGRYGQVLVPAAGRPLALIGSSDAADGRTDIVLGAIL